jgi:uncharacterized protein (TIGR02217 family)
MAFLDVYMPDAVPGYPCVSAPRTRTTIQSTWGGNENRNQEWEHPLHRFTMPDGVRSWDVVESLGKMWRITAGPYRSFAWRDPLDKASCDLLAANEPDINVTARISATDQAIGTGDGFTDTFPLVKRYSYGGQSYDRTIHLPVLSTVIVADNGTLVDSADYTVSRPGGEVQFNTPPPDGHAITAGFLFDCEVRFESDDAFEVMVKTWQAGGFADLALVEVRPC